MRARNQAAFVELRGDGDRRDDRVRHGHRQARRALRRPCRNPQVDRGLLPGDRPRRPRRRSGRGLAVLGRRGFRPRPTAASSTEVEPERRPGERERLNALAALVEAPTCRRAILLRHFGEDPPEACGNCDNCLDPPETIDATEVARKLLSAAFRTEMRFGVGHLADVLAGNDNEKVRSFGHHRLSVFGIANAEELRLVRPVARALIARDALRADAYGGLSFGPGAKPILKGEQELVASPIPPPRRRAARRRQDGPADPLFEALREARRKLASESACRPTSIFHDSTLREIAASRPRTLGELGTVQGVGAVKLARYGEAMLAALAALKRKRRMIRQLDDKVLVSGQICARRYCRRSASRASPWSSTTGPTAKSPASRSAWRSRKPWRRPVWNIARSRSSAASGRRMSDAMQDAIKASKGKLLAFCRSGTRSALAWAVAKSEEGMPREEIERRLSSAGVDPTPIAHLL